MKSLHDYLLKIRPLVNARGLEIAARLPKNTLGKHFRWADGKPDGVQIPPAHIPNVVRALCETFGQIEIDGWRIIAAFNDPAIIAIRAIPDRTAESIEVDSGFEYLQPEWRMVYDDFDFVHYFLADSLG